METTNQNKVLKRAIVLCWIALAFCFIIKICGGNFFAIAVENERFIAVCKYVDKHQWLLLAVLLANYLIVGYIYFCAVLNQLKLTGKQFLVLIPINLPISISIFSGIFFGGLIGWVLYKLQDYTDLKLKEFKKKTIFDLTKEELYELMGNSTLTDQEKDAVEYRVIYHYKGQKWYQSVGYSKRNCQYLYKSAVTKLNNLIKQ